MGNSKIVKKKKCKNFIFFEYADNLTIFECV
jgi:hypothetical protein